MRERRLSSTKTSGHMVCNVHYYNLRGCTSKLLISCGICIKTFYRLIEIFSNSKRCCTSVPVPSSTLASCQVPGCVASLLKTHVARGLKQVVIQTALQKMILQELPCLVRNHTIFIPISILLVLVLVLQVHHRPCFQTILHQHQKRNLNPH